MNPAGIEEKEIDRIYTIIKRMQKAGVTT